jgi:hypothetical protein
MLTWGEGIYFLTQWDLECDLEERTEQPLPIVVRAYDGCSNISKVLQTRGYRLTAEPMGPPSVKANTSISDFKLQKSSALWYVCQLHGLRFILLFVGPILVGEVATASLSKSDSPVARRSWSEQGMNRSDFSPPPVSRNNYRPSNQRHYCGKREPVSCTGAGTVAYVCFQRRFSYR